MMRRAEYTPSQLKKVSINRCAVAMSVAPACDASPKPSRWATWAIWLSISRPTTAWRPLPGSHRMGYELRHSHDRDDVLALPPAVRDISEEVLARHHQRQRGDDPHQQGLAGI